MKNIAVPGATNTVRHLIDFTILQANASENEQAGLKPESL